LSGHSLSSKVCCTEHNVVMYHKVALCNIGSHVSSWVYHCIACNNDEKES